MLGTNTKHVSMSGSCSILSMRSDFDDEETKSNNEDDDQGISVQRRIPTSATVITMDENSVCTSEITTTSEALFSLSSSASASSSVLLWSSPESQTTPKATNATPTYHYRRRSALKLEEHAINPTADLHRSAPQLKYDDESDGQVRSQRVQRLESRRHLLLQQHHPASSPSLRTRSSWKADDTDGADTVPSLLLE